MNQKEMTAFARILATEIVGALVKSGALAVAATAAPSAIAKESQLMNGKQLAIALFGGSAASSRGEWIIYGVKKANAIFAAQGREKLIFTGRLSTPTAITEWLWRHPEFVPSRILAPFRKRSSKRGEA